MKHVIVHSVAGPDEATVAELGRVGVSTAHEAMAQRGLLATYLRPIFPRARIAGRAVTVWTRPGDNLMIHAAMEECRSGDILVVATTAPSTDGMFGELLATVARARGVCGVITDAGVRDVATLTDMGFPVWSRAISAQGTAKASPGSVNVPVVIAGGLVRPGDVIVADDDGVLVVPLEEAKEVAAAAFLREEHEREIREQFAAGAASLDVFGLRDVLSKLDVRYATDVPNQRPGETVPEVAEVAE